MNVKNALQIGKACMEAYEKNYLRVSIIKYVAMGSPWIHPGKGLTWEQSELLTDIEVVFNRTHSIIGSEEFDLHHLFSHELAPIPTSLFLDDGSMISASLK